VEADFGEETISLNHPAIQTVSRKKKKIDVSEGVRRTNQEIPEFVEEECDDFLEDQVVDDIVSNVRYVEPREYREVRQFREPRERLESVEPGVTRVARELREPREPREHVSLSFEGDQVTGEIVSADCADRTAQEIIEEDAEDFRDMLHQENVTGKNINFETNIMPARNPHNDENSSSPSPIARKCETFRNVKICDELNVKGGVTFKDCSFSFKSGQRVRARTMPPSGTVNDLPMLCCLFNNIHEATATGSETPGVVLPRVCSGDDGRVIFITNTSPEIVTVFANTCKPNFICNNKTSMTLFPCNDDGSLPTSTMLRVECGNWVPYS